MSEDGWGRAVVVLVATMALVGACSGDEPSSSELAASTTTATAARDTAATDTTTTTTTTTGTTAPAPDTTSRGATPATTAVATTAPISGTDPASVPVGPSAGCGADPATAVAPGEQRATITSSGVDRWFFERVPPAHDGRQPLPLVLDFHGYSEGAEIHLLMSALGPFGDEHDFVTLTPQGTGPVPGWDTTLGSPDLAFVGDLLDHAEATLCIDTNRIFVTGLSNGAFMSSAIACAYADRVAAVAPVAGVRDVIGCAQERPVPLVAFHGTADGFVSYDGGLGERALDLPAPDGSGRTLREAGVEQTADVQTPSVPDIAQSWAARNGCTGPELESAVSVDVALLTYGCPAGAEVELYRVDGGGHSWPGSDFSAQVVSVIGPTTFSIDANEVMWAFFMAHPLPAS
ncbi:MAG TPA: hypothetical protein VIT64_08410 [Ilumatobacteraceae bacterium]